MRTVLAVVLSGVLLVGCGTSDKPVKCEPQCEGRECGDDGCGGTCGGCDDGLECTNDACQNGQCAFVTNDFFCMILGACVPSGTIDPNNPCAQCSPASLKTGWTPVDDGTSCGLDKVCHEGSCCDVGAHCKGRQCGDDGCGGVCGECPEGGTCEEGTCFVPCDECLEDELRCLGKDKYQSCALLDGCWTWDDVQDCPAGETCICEAAGEGDVCVAVAGSECVCVPECEGKECGGDGCGGSCGQCEGINVICEADLCQCAGPECGEVCCASYQVCTDDLACCDPACEGKECGEDGCGGVCGVCEGGDWVSCVLGTCVCQGTVCPKACCANSEICDSEGNCCVDQCNGAECGPNGCGGVCGQCPSGGMCINGKCPPEGKVCNDDNEVPWDGCTDFDLSEFRVNTYTADYQARAAVAGLADGGYVVVWESGGEDEPDSIGVFGRRFAADGWPVAAPFPVNSEVLEDQEAPAVAALADGGYVVVWESWKQDGNGDGVFGQRYLADGSKAAGEFQVNTSTLGDQERPAVAALGDGFVVLFDGMDVDGDGNGLFARVYDGDGEPVAEQFPVNDETVGEQSAAAATPRSDGSAVLAWQSATVDGSGMGIMARVLTAAGELDGAPVLLNSYTVGDQREVALAGVGMGVAAFWHSEGQDNDGLAVVGGLFDEALASVGNPGLASTWVAGDQKNAAVASLVGGQVVAVWQSDGQDGSSYGVYQRLFAADGTAIDGTESLCHLFVASIQSWPAVAGLADGGWVVVWQSFGQDGDLYDIFAARFNSVGELQYH